MKLKTNVELEAEDERRKGANMGVATRVGIWERGDVRHNTNKTNLRTVQYTLLLKRTTGLNLRGEEFPLTQDALARCIVEYCNSPFFFVSTH